MDDAFGVAARERRIAARRVRVQERLAALRNTTSDGKAKEVKEVQSRQPLQLLQEAQQSVQQISAASNARIAQIQEQGSRRTAAHDAVHEKRAEDAKAAIEQAVKDAESSSSKLSAAWDAALALPLAQDLHAAMQAQMVGCAEALASQDAVNASLAKVLETQDEEYGRMLKAGGAEVDALVRALAQQREEAQAVCSEQLQRLQLSFKQEREGKREDGNALVNLALSQRAQAEQDLLDHFVTALQGHSRTLEEQLVGDSTQYNELKQRLEVEVQDLELQAEGLRAGYVLNQEKLNFSHHILSQREAENRVLVTKLKRQMAAQARTLGTLKAQQSKVEARQTEQMGRLSEEHRRVAAHLDDLQSSLMGTQLHETQRFGQVRALRERQLSGLAARASNLTASIDHELLQWQVVPSTSTSAVETARTIPSAAVTDRSQGGAQEASRANMATIKEELDAITARALQPTQQGTTSCAESPNPEPEGQNEAQPESNRTMETSARPGATARQGLGASTGRSTQGFIRSQVGTPGGVSPMVLPGVELGIPREWPLLEQGLQQYHRLLQDRATAARQMQQLQQRKAGLAQILSAQMA